MSGTLITFEGGEGAGKSTLIRRLQLDLEEQGFKVLATREPGGTELGEQLRHLLLNPYVNVSIAPMAELCLFLAARAQHIAECIRPALESGSIVLCDRFNHSTIAYQGAGRELGIEKVESLCHLVCNGLAPDLTFYLDVEPEVGLSRSKQTSKEAAAGELDKIESEQITFHERIRGAFLKIAQRDARLQVINAHQSPSDIYQQVQSIIKQQIL